MKLELIDEKQDREDSLYRYEDDYNRIRERQFFIVKETEHGWWIRHSWNSGLKFVYKKGKNNYAKKTRREAMENYWHRKHRQLAILKNKIETTEGLLYKAEVRLGIHEEKREGLLSYE